MPRSPRPRAYPRLRATALPAVLSATLPAVLGACGDGLVVVERDGPIDVAAAWRTATPAEVGIDGSALLSAAAAASATERMRSVVVVRAGRLAFERYFGPATADSLADVRSVTKSVVSTLAGLALADGHIASPDQPITDFLDPAEFDVRPEHASVTVGHLLTMSSGFYWAEINTEGYNDWILSGDHVDYLLSRPLDAEPGAAFVYNSAAVHLLGVVVERAVGRPLPAYADDVLFRPMGVSERRWEQLPGDFVNGGSGLDLRPRDLARLGQLFLQDGWSGAARVLPEGWVDAATEPRWASLGSVEPLGPIAYGRLWWIDRERDAFFAWGYGGQFVYVAPALDLVVVVTTEWRGVSGDIGSGELQRRALSLIVDGVLPAVRP